MPEVERTNLDPRAEPAAADAARTAIVPTERLARPVETLGPVVLGGEDRTPHPGQRPMSLAALLRYKWTFVGVTVLVAGLAVPAIWLLNLPKYRATADIKVEPIEQSFIERTEETGPILYYQSYLSTQAETLKNSAVLDRVLDRPEVQRTDWYKGLPHTLLSRLRPLAPARDRLAGDLVVFIPPQAQLLRVTLDAGTPGDARTIVDCVVEEYLAYAKANRFVDDRYLLQSLFGERRAREIEVDAHMAAVAELQRELKTTDPDALVAQRRLDLDRLIWKRGESERQLAMARAALAQMESAETPAASQPTAVQFALDEEWRRLAATRDETQDQLAIAELSFGADHPRLVELRTALAQANDRLARREALVTQLAAARSVTNGDGERGSLVLADRATLARQIAQLESELKILVEAESAEKTLFDAMLAKAQTYASKCENLRKSRDEVDRINRRIDNLERRKLVPPTIKFISNAVEPATPVEDKRMKLSLGALFGAFACGAGAAFLRAKLSPTVHGAQDVTAAPTGAFLGLLPLHRSRTPIEDSPMQHECIRMIRTTLLRRLADRKASVVQITSAGDGAGKSTLARLLSRSLALSGRRVVLVDADVRNPTVARSFAVEPSPGLIEVLQGTQNLLAAVRPTGTPQLSILTARAATSGAELERLANGALHGILASLRDTFDYVLVDSGPLLPIADAAMLATHVDGTVMVVRQDRCRMPDVAAALGLLSASGGHLLGTVFIGSRANLSYPTYYTPYTVETTTAQAAGPAERTEG